MKSHKNSGLESIVNRFRPKNLLTASLIGLSSLGIFNPRLSSARENEPEKPTGGYMLFTMGRGDLGARTAGWNGGLELGYSFNTTESLHTTTSIGVGFSYMKCRFTEELAQKYEGYEPLHYGEIGMQLVSGLGLPRPRNFYIIGGIGVSREKITHGESTPSTSPLPPCPIGCYKISKATEVETLEARNHLTGSVGLRYCYLPKNTKKDRKEGVIFGVDYDNRRGIVFSFGGVGL